MRNTFGRFLVTVLAASLVAACAAETETTTTTADTSAELTATTEEQPTTTADEQPATTSATDETSENLLETARAAGMIDVGFVAARPLSYINEDTGEAEGAGIDLARVLLDRVGIPQMETIFVTFDIIIPGLQNDRWDMSGFHFFITPERCEQVAFTNPLARYTQGALVAEGNPLDLHSYEDIGANPEVRVAAQAGSAETEWAKEAGVEESQIQSYPEERLAIEAVRQGRADVYLQAKFSLNSAQELYDVTGVEVAEPFTGPIVDGQEVIAYSGYAVRPGDQEFLDALNAEIEEMNSSGELLEIQAPYGYTADLMPEPDVTATELCASGS